VKTCKQREALLTEYNACLRIHNATVLEMEHARAVSDVRTYMDLRVQVHSSDVKCTTVKLNLQKHIEEHGCARAIGTSG